MSTPFAVETCSTVDEAVIGVIEEHGLTDKTLITQAIAYEMTFAAPKPIRFGTFHLHHPDLNRDAQYGISYHAGGWAFAAYQLGDWGSGNIFVRIVGGPEASRVTDSLPWETGQVASLHVASYDSDSEDLADFYKRMAHTVLWFAVYACNNHEDGPVRLHDLMEAFQAAFPDGVVTDNSKREEA